MKTTIASLATVGLVIVFLAGGQAIAQDAQQQATLEGQLIRVDAAASTLVVQASPDGEPMEFQYSADTEVVGEIESVQGLVGQPGTQLKVTYESDGPLNMATQIEITSVPED